MINHEIFSDSTEKTTYIVYVNSGNGYKSIKACKGAATRYMQDNVLRFQFKSWSKIDCPNSIEFSNRFRYAFAYEIIK